MSMVGDTPVTLRDSLAIGRASNINGPARRARESTAAKVANKSKKSEEGDGDPENMALGNVNFCSHTALGVPRG